MIADNSAGKKLHISTVLSDKLISQYLKMLD